MAIGSRVPGASVIAGQYGIISAEAQPVVISQEVRLVDPAATLITMSQSVQQIDNARQIVVVQQRVLGAGVAPSEVTPPAAYVIINDVDVTSMTARDTVRVTFNEDQAATAGIFMFVEMGAAVNIPSFHGKTIRIETHTDPSDINSEIIPLFTGWIETARHDRQRMGIEFRATDLREERLGDDADAITGSLRMDGALYSPVTQKEKAEGRELVTEYLKTYPGSVGYMRNGFSRYYTWGTQKNGVDKYISKTFVDTDVAYDDIETEFQTRSSIKNKVSVTIDYRWSLLRTVIGSVNAVKQRKVVSGQVCGSVVGKPWLTGCRDVYDYRAFRRSQMTGQAQSVPGFKTTSFQLIPLDRISTPQEQLLNGLIVIDTLWSQRHLWCSGFNATGVKRIAQPVTESYTFDVIAPQSVDAYKKEVEGSKHQFSHQVEWDSAPWVDFNTEGGLGSFRDEVADAEDQARADGGRDILAGAFNAAYAIAKKEIIESHRKNFIAHTTHRILSLDVGDIVQHQNRIVTAKGQVTGLEYTIADGIRNTRVTTAVLYMDTAIATPAEDFTIPEKPSVVAEEVRISARTKYNSDSGGFDIDMPDISPQYTDEIKPEIEKSTFVMPLDVQDITLINGY